MRGELFHLWSDAGAMRLLVYLFSWFGSMACFATISACAVWSESSPCNRQWTGDVVFYSSMRPPKQQSGDRFFSAIDKTMDGFVECRTGFRKHRYFECNVARNDKKPQRSDRVQGETVSASEV